MTHEALNLWLLEADRVLKANESWAREFRYKFRNLKIGLGNESEADLNKGDTK